jgi:hypothetical protein
LKLTRSDRLKHLVRLIQQLSKDINIVRFISGLFRKARGEKPLGRQDPGSGDTILVRQSDSETLGSFRYPIPKGTDVDNFDTDRNNFDPVPDPEIDFSKEMDLEAYTQSLAVPPEVIESWVAAGILRPDETQVAEKMLKIMRKKDSRRKKLDPNSTHD